jgi:hypothetical protein
MTADRQAVLRVADPGAYQQAVRVIWLFGPMPLLSPYFRLDPPRSCRTMRELPGEKYYAALRRRGTSPCPYAVSAGNLRRRLQDL